MRRTPEKYVARQLTIDSRNTAFPTSKNVEVVHQPIHSPHFSQSDFLFYKTKLEVKVCRFDRVEETKANSQELLTVLTVTNDFQE